jgi:hypothetical protein
MHTQAKDRQQVVDTGNNRNPLWVHDAADTTTEQPSAADPASERVQELSLQLICQGLDTSLRSLHVWANLGRQLGLTALRSPATATYELFETLLAAQREVSRNSSPPSVNSCKGSSGPSPLSATVVMTSAPGGTATERSREPVDTDQRANAGTHGRGSPKVLPTHSGAECPRPHPLTQPHRTNQTSATPGWIPISYLAESEQVGSRDNPLPIARTLASFRLTNDYIKVNPQ